MNTENVQCAHQACTCPGVPDVAASGSEIYCCDGCADGVGYNHTGCDCANPSGKESSGD